MGRTPKSPTEKRLTGAGKRRVRPTNRAAAPAASGFTPPPWLIGKAALGVWHRITPELRRLNILSTSDADVFGRYCQHFAEWIEAADTIKREGSTVLVKMTNSDERMPRLHPAVRVRDLAEKHLIDIEDRFGGSPLARYRLIAQQAAHPGAWGDLFAQKPDSPAEPTAAAASSGTSPIGMLQRATLN